MNHFVIADPKKCIGCYTCEAGCVNVHQKVGLADYPRLTVMHTDDGTMPVQCRQCDDAPCEKVCPVKAITFEDNAIQLSESLCIGCKMCGIACPFGAITPYGEAPGGSDLPIYGGSFELPLHTQDAAEAEYVHPMLDWQVGHHTVAVKCDLCTFLPTGPECIRVCPTKALHFVEPDKVHQSDEEKRKAAATEAMMSFSHHKGV